MKQTETLKRLERPNANTNNEYVWYEKGMQPQVKFETKKLKSLYQQHEAGLLAIAEKEAWDISLGEGFP